MNHHKANNPGYIPSPAEIREHCRRFQAAWSPATREERTVCRPTPWMLVEVHLELPNERPRDRVA